MTCSSCAARTSAFNPRISPGPRSTKAMLADPEAARSEWEAEFRSDLTALFDDQRHRRRGRSCSSARVAAALWHQQVCRLRRCLGRPQRRFRDLHRSHRRAQGGGALDLRRGARAARLRSIRATSPRNTPRLAREYGCRKIIGDNYAGEWVANAFADAGIKYERMPAAQVAALSRGAAAFQPRRRLAARARDRSCASCACSSDGCTDPARIASIIRAMAPTISLMRVCGAFTSP